MLTEVFVPGLRDFPLSFLYGRSRASDPDLSHAIHESSGRKPWTAAQFDDGMRLTFIEDAPRDAVIRGLPDVGHRVEFRAVDNYRSIVDRCVPIERIMMRFVTPTCAGHRSMDRRRPDRQVERYNLLPEPRLVFPSINNRWAGPPLPEQDWSLIWVQDVFLQTRIEHIRYERSPEVGGGRISFTFRGVVGRAEYWFPTLTDEQKCGMHALAQFARYSGVGNRTSYGMGVVEVTCGELESRDAGPQPSAVSSAAR